MRSIADHECSTLDWGSWFCPALSWNWSKPVMNQCYPSACFTVVAALQNLALNKPAWQHSTYVQYSASLAVDGDSNPDFYDGSCSHTGSENTYRTWAVDLQIPSWVDCVEVMRRAYAPHGMLMTQKLALSSSNFSMTDISFKNHQLFYKHH